jgi:hypothetical protein
VTPGSSELAREANPPRYLVSVVPSPAPEPNDADIADLVTRSAMTALAARDFASVAAAFSAPAAPTPAHVAAVWNANARAMGDITRWVIVDRTRQDGFETRSVHFELERGELQALVSIAPDTRKLASLFVSKPAPPARYIKPDRYRSEAVVVGSAPYPLEATLALPNGSGPFPAVVLVHGSGPNDRDETVGANKIFRDLAAGLASAGIAVLRYDKRTLRYGDQLTRTLTLDEEVVDDAVDAVRLLASRPEIDPRRVFVIGHSLGGLLAPEIAVRAGGVAGVVLLAPPARPPWDIVHAQMRYLRAPRETLIAVERAIIEINFGGTPELLGIPFAYWRDWASRDGIAMARTFGKPVLVLHGDRDYQVTREDLAIWKTGLAGAKLVTFATFSGDNHLFIRRTGTPGPGEYKVPGHLDDRVIDRLIAFVRQP